MGAEQFNHAAHGKTALAAFQAAVKQAQYDHGHAGYTGTIAEKSEFVLIEPRAASYDEAQERADKLMRDGDPRIDDKWGPAGCIQYGDKDFLFFGYASS